MTKTRPYHRGYPPMQPETWVRITTWLKQAEASLANFTAPRPDIHLLAMAPSGPFRSVWIPPDPQSASGVLAVHFEVQNKDRGPRFCPPYVFAPTVLLLLFGGGLSVNDNKGHGQGWAYLKLWGADSRMMLGRVITDTPVGAVAKQHAPDGERADHHNYDPAYFTTTTAEAVREGEGRPIGTPRKGRREAIATAIRKYRANHKVSEVKVTEAEYLATMQRAFRVLDAYRLGRS